MTSTARLLLSLPLVLVVVSGCKTSSTPAKVSGKVTYKGEAVPAGTITFQTEQGGVFYYPLNPDGTYSGSDLPTGEMVVLIETESVNPKGRPKMDYGRKKEGGDVSGDYMKKMKERGVVPESSAPTGNYVPIPKKYSDPKATPLKVNLTKGNNKNDFHLED